MLSDLKMDSLSDTYNIDTKEKNYTWLICDFANNVWIMNFQLNEIKFQET